MCARHEVLTYAVKYLRAWGAERLNQSAVGSSHTGLLRVSHGLEWPPENLTSTGHIGIEILKSVTRGIAFTNDQFHEMARDPKSGGTGEGGHRK